MGRPPHTWAHKLGPALCLALMLLGGGAAASGQSFYGAYVSGVPTTSPKPTGGAFWATRISQSTDTWSFTKMEFSLSPDGKSIVSSPRSGLVTGTKHVGPCTIYALGTAGVATNGQTTTSAFSEGGFAKCPVKTKGWALIAGFEVVQAAALGGSQKIIEIGFGRATK